MLCSGSFGVDLELMYLVALSDLALEVHSGRAGRGTGATGSGDALGAAPQQWARAAALTLGPAWCCTEEAGGGLACRSCYAHPLGKTGMEEATLGKERFGDQHSELSLPSAPRRLNTSLGRGEKESSRLKESDVAPHEGLEVPPAV